MQQTAQTQKNPLAQEFVNYYPSKRCTTRQVAMIENEIELDDLVANIKVCRAKLKQMLKRYDELKALNEAHSYNPHADA